MINSCLKNQGIFALNFVTFYCLIYDFIANNTAMGLDKELSQLVECLPPTNIPTVYILVAWIYFFGINFPVVFLLTFS